MSSFTKQILDKVSKNRMETYMKKAETSLGLLVKTNQPMFEWLLSRLNNLFDGALEPYIGDHYAQFKGPNIGQGNKRQI